VVSQSSSIQDCYLTFYSAYAEFSSSKEVLHGMYIALKNKVSFSAKLHCRQATASLAGLVTPLSVSPGCRRDLSGRAERSETPFHGIDYILP